ncbi:hypothetical protein OF83DRAFT_1138062 [Amylostereum chailletii]|nr:hypothetical protein OF83DRAFT_1138062 [Amylostereum chailletii]
MLLSPVEHRLPESHTYPSTLDMAPPYTVNDNERPPSGEVLVEGSPSSSYHNQLSLSTARATSKHKSSCPKKRKSPDSQSDGTASKRPRAPSFTALPTSRQLSMAAAASHSRPPLSTVQPNRAAGPSKSKLVATHSLVQTHRCYVPRYKTGVGVSTCVACTRRQAGDSCRFMNIRVIAFNEKDEVAGSHLVPPTDNVQVASQSPTFHFPTEWNIPLGPVHIRRTKCTIAQALLPTLKQELEHLQLKDADDAVGWRSLETHVRATCDTCMTSLFSGTWMCMGCGREACSDCHERVLQLWAEADPSTKVFSDPAKAEFLLCHFRKPHKPKDFVRTSRFTTAQLVGIVEEMEGILAQPDHDALPDLMPHDEPLEFAESITQRPSVLDSVSAPAAPTEAPLLSEEDLALQYPALEEDIVMADIVVAERPSQAMDRADHSLAPPVSGADGVVQDFGASTPSFPSPLAVPSPDVFVIPPQSTPFTFSLPLNGSPPLPASSQDAPPPPQPRDTVDTPPPSIAPALKPDEPSAPIIDELSYASQTRNHSLPPIAYMPTALPLDSAEVSKASTPVVVALSLPDQLVSPATFSAPVHTVEEPIGQLIPPAVNPPSAQTFPETELPIMIDPSGVPSHAAPTFTDEALTEDVFRRVWAEGAPIVVTGLLPKFDIQWTPEYFKQEYGKQECMIVECQSESTKTVTVGEFFEKFGQRDALVGPEDDVWKLKDWPPSSDFKVSFPELYADFAKAVPVPTYTRRDGVLNVASHFPSNTVAPDIGPKMYNAQATFETAGSHGSTRLHMDMADAVNMMVYAERGPDGRAGCAAWDLFRAEDADEIRKYLRSKFGVPNTVDPIHAQHYYLDADMRKELFEKHGAQSFRVYQFPGQAVFIPAGCAHQVRQASPPSSLHRCRADRTCRQVCNLADCIKVAADFVSPENIAKCAQLTEEFRRENLTKVWKEDVLQLRMMMWFAWLSCSRTDFEASPEA